MLNPITFTEHVVGDFLRYQLTTYPFADERIHKQMRRLLNLEETRATPLLRGPYVSLSRSFRSGATIAELVSEGVLHPHLVNLAPHARSYGHQDTAMRAIASGRTTLISTGTGSGKTEAFLYPIISHCLTLRDEGAPPGIAAVIVYPMNALAEDQVGRMRELLAGTGVTFGLYIGKTPDKADDVPGVRLRQGASQSDYKRAVARASEERTGHAVHPAEERVARDEMRTAGKQPRILLTNVKQLELLLTRQKDAELFDGARLEYIVFDEAHTYSGAAGAETATLIRRLRTYCGRSPADTVCVATSATIADPIRGSDIARDFASRFFGVAPESVAVVGEEYEPDVWATRRSAPPAPSVEANTLLAEVLAAVAAVEGESSPSTEALANLQGVVMTLMRARLDITRWQASLYDIVAENELAYQASELLGAPRALDDLASRLTKQLERPVSEQEILAVLALGAIAQKDGRPLIRPVVHVFVRGVAGAVVTFPLGETAPKLWLSAEDSEAADADLVRLPVLSCTTCGQHYFVHHVEDFVFTEHVPGGGTAVDSGVVWRSLEASQGGRRVLLVDRRVNDDDEHGSGPIGGAGAPSAWGSRLYLCRFCGALHPAEQSRCAGCGRERSLVPLTAVRQRAQNPGYLTTCIACGALGRQRVGVYREPARPVRAVTVSDVHVLAQNMLHYAERRRLLVFADNRQEAAFQAGWMRDHARRYRLRALMFERLTQGPASIGDLTAYLDDTLDEDDDLSRALVPEVWRVHRKEAEGIRHAEERKRFLRIQGLREITTSPRQRIGLEPWGRLVVEYPGLTADLPFVGRWAPVLATSTMELVAGIATLLDVTRRNAVLLDRDGRIFSRFWGDGDFEIQRGYLPLMPGIPKALKLRRGADDDDGRVQQWVSARGQTLALQIAAKFGVPPAREDEFFDELWSLLADDLILLVPVTLTGSRGRALPRCAGVRQIDADRLLLRANHGVFRCDTCRRSHNRPTPHMACPAWRCAGILVPAPEDADNYDLKVLDEHFAMLRPREHSAQIPADDRELIERQFKGEHEQINTLVCTPTLELGVDIGALDSVLMRNVPPLPANYWQRAGRAGRRHRMAVNVTYARTASHDRAYFVDPLKLLEGEITPPRFNLRNAQMIRKHVHATVLTVLSRLAREGSGVKEDDRRQIDAALHHCFPTQVKQYLFDDAGNVRPRPLDISLFATTVSRHEVALIHDVAQVFEQAWPMADRGAVSRDRLTEAVQGTAPELERVLSTLKRRLDWALEQMRRLEESRRRRGTLDADEDALMARCDRLVKKLKGIETRRRRDAEGFDDTNTYAVLAAEGFLPGYGLDTGGVVGLHQAPRYGSDLRDWEVRRATPLALREYVPGNLIYANGHRFFPRFYQLEATEPTGFQVDVVNQAVVETGVAQPGTMIGLGAALLAAIPICDVDLPHQSHISDDEEHRFQLAVSVFGHEQGRHGRGKAYQWGQRDVLVRSAVHLRLVNVGAAQLVRSTGTLGYPVCTVCGQSRSPLASQADLNQFSTDHRERCGRPVANVGFFADVVADALCLRDCENREEAYSLAEALRMGAAEVLEMEAEDLQVLLIGRPGNERVDILLYDPMPGGSGLLDQMLERWGAVVAAAKAIVDECPSACNRACIDCLFTFRNAFYHEHLSRHTALGLLRASGAELHFAHDVPAVLPTSQGEGVPVNEAESTLRLMLERAGFPTPLPQRTLTLAPPLGSTTPDFFFDDPAGRLDGVCIYLDGMGVHAHGDPSIQRRDRAIREELRNRGYEVLEIPFGHLTDRDAMVRHLYRLGRIMLDREQADRLRNAPHWFE